MAYLIIFTSRVKRWLGSTQSPRIMHLFDQACNLSNEEGEMISIVMPAIGPGPFSLVVAETRPFPEIMALDSQIIIESGQLKIAQLKIDLNQERLWDPGIDWNMLRRKTAVWQNELPALERMVMDYREQIGWGEAAGQQRLEEGLGILLLGIKNQDQAEIKKGVNMVAGLGQGLTPSGDDLLLGVIYGLWATWPEEYCQPLINVMVETAVPKTTSLSAAWLQAAGRGEGGILWHEFGNQLAICGNQWSESVRRILQTGHSSGADALWGFTAVVNIFRHDLQV